MRSVYQSIEYGISDGFFTDDVEPLGYRQKARNGGGTAMTIFDDLHEVDTVLRLKSNETEVVNDEMILSPVQVKELGGLPCCPDDLCCFERFMPVEEVDVACLGTSCVSMSTQQVALTTPSRSGDEHDVACRDMVAVSNWLIKFCSSLRVDP